MNYITTTDLRTKASQLVSDLKRGSKVSLIHRSKVVGIIEPSQEPLKTFDAAKFKRMVKDINLPHTTYAQREKIYRTHLTEKYGKGISRHK